MAGERDELNLKLMQAAIQNVSKQTNETQEFISKTLPGILEKHANDMESKAELIALKALRLHEDNCEPRKQYAALNARVAEDSKVLDLLTEGKELTSRQRRATARATGATVSISPQGVRVRIPKYVWKLAIGAGVAALLSLLGLSAKSLTADAGDAVAADVDTDSDGRPTTIARP